MENNQKFTIILADDDIENINKMKKIFEVRDDFEIISECKNGEELINDIIKYRPNLVIMDVILSQQDGFIVMQKVKNHSINTKFLIVSALSSDTFVQKAIRLGAEYYMLKPIDGELLYKRAVECLLPSSKQEVDIKVKKVLDEKISNIFITVGIPAHIKGYYFLREAVKMAIENPTIINSITKTLYPSIAKRFETSASKVERAIRHAIEVAWNRGKIDKINNIFGIDIYVNNEKPTNGEFIALVADKMLLEG